MKKYIVKSSMLFRATKHPLPDGLVAKLALDGKTASTPMLMFRCLFCDTKFASTQRRARQEWTRRCLCHTVRLRSDRTRLRSHALLSYSSAMHVAETGRWKTALRVAEDGRAEGGRAECGRAERRIGCSMRGCSAGAPQALMNGAVFTDCKLAVMSLVQISAVELSGVVR